jgi:hypothetical protein
MMSNLPVVKTLASLLMVALLAPTMYFMIPQKAEAQWAVAVVSDTSPTSLLDLAKNALTSAYSILIQANTWVTALAEYAQLINTYVLQPIAFVVSGQLMKALTASVMKYVIGKANGTGIPQFVVDVQKSVRSINDFQAQAYFRQVSLTNSPFATSIANALQINYNQNTSLAGYWKANLCTLGRNIPTYNQSFLSGAWSQGGTAAWFQLTTQTQNNPYMLYQSSQAQLQNVLGNGVGGGSGARLQQLAWGQGFMSWCGTTDSATQTQNAAVSDYQACMANGGTGDQCQATFSSAGGKQTSLGVNPGDPCTDKDGNTGTIQTPGTVIKATLDKVLGGQQDKINSMGNISAQVNQFLSSIGTILNTVNLAANILGGGNSSGGLLNAGRPGGALSSFGAPTSSSGLTTGYGVNGSQLASSGASSAASGAQQGVTQTSGNPATNNIDQNGGTGGTGATGGTLGQIQAYRTAWNAIGLSANETLTGLQSMRDTCTAFPNTSEATDAQNTISNEVSPVITQVSQAQAVADAATAQYNIVQSESPSSSTYSADTQKLDSLVPTATDISNAKFNATAFGGATANPTGSLTVSGSSLVDQMNLIRTNAGYLTTNFCTTQGGQGGG